MPSFSGVLTWDTILSSTQRTLIGTLLPHLSQSALIPHFTAIKPVLLELGFITPCFSSITPDLSWVSSIKVSELKNLNWVGVKVAVLDVVAVYKGVDFGESVRDLKRDIRPLDAADIFKKWVSWCCVCVYKLGYD